MARVPTGMARSSRTSRAELVQGMHDFRLERKTRRRLVWWVLFNCVVVAIALTIATAESGPSSLLAPVFAVCVSMIPITVLAGTSHG
jgi:hypothetical protein